MDHAAAPAARGHNARSRLDRAVSRMKHTMFTARSRRSRFDDFKIASQSPSLGKAGALGVLTLPSPSPRGAGAPIRVVALILCCPLLFALVGCEGIDRTHDNRVVDITPPADEDLGPTPIRRVRLPSTVDEVESMLASRAAYIEHLVSVERAYLQIGDTEKANWARRQREQTERVEVYPYLREGTSEQHYTVAPRESIPAADELYLEAMTLYDTFEGVPFVGFTKLNHEDCRKAVNMYKRILRDYPSSDKVDDAAYYAGVIYKEFLREDDPDNELALRYFKWALRLDPKTPHPARFDAAVVYDHRLHEYDRAIELYHQVLETEEAGIQSNQRYAATRIEQLTDDDGSHLRPRDERYVGRERPIAPVRRDVETRTSYEPTTADRVDLGYEERIDEPRYITSTGEDAGDPR